MKWFDKWFYKKSMWAWDHKEDMEYREEDTVPQGYGNALYSSTKRRNIVTASSGAQCLESKSTGFNLYKANGGVIVETQRYDNRKDEHIRELHIITEDQNLGEALSRIVTFESLKS
jgi:hypothetical protein